MTIEETVLEIAENVALEYGIYVVDTEYKKEGKNFFLKVYIDKESGASIDDCEIISRALEAVLDERDVIKEKYSLIVSSPGVDRRLKKEREFLYYRGREVDVKLYGMIDKMKEFRGVLKDFHDGTAVIETGDKIIEVKPAQTVWIKLAFDF